jgi:hypothetical protein
LNLNVCFINNSPYSFSFSPLQVCPIQEYQRKLHPDDLPLQAQVKRKQRGEVSHFLVRRNPNYPRRRQLLPSILEKSCSNLTGDSPPKHNFTNLSSLSLPIAAAAAAATLSSSFSSSVATTTTATTITTQPPKAIAMRTFMFNDVNIVKSSSLDSCQTCGNHKIDGVVSEVEKYFSEININKFTMEASKAIVFNNNNNNNNNNDSINSSTKPNNSKICSKCKNSFRSCEFCMKNFDGTLAIQPSMENYNNHSNNSKYDNHNNITSSISSMAYNPVYNVREIKTNGTAAFGVGSKSIDGEKNLSMVSLGSDDGNAVFYRNKQNVKGKRLSLNLSSGSSSKSNSRRNSLVCEAVNTNPAQGVGNFIYI